MAADAFGPMLRRRRLAAGLTQEELADRACLSVRAISDLERGRTARPFRHSVRRLAAALGLGGAAAEEFAAHAFAHPGAAESDAASPLTAQRGSPGAAAPRQLPSSVRHFAGRSDELATLRGLLDGPGNPAPGSEPGASPQSGPGMFATIVGAAGIGKTTLAVHFAHQVTGRFPDGQVYVNLRGFDPALAPTPPAEAVQLALDAFAVPAEQIPTSLDAQVGLYRSLLADKHALIVLDNAADAEQVRPLLPGSPTCLVIVTSRNRLAGLVALDGAKPLALEILTTPEAHDLLVRMLGAERVTAEPDVVAGLIEACGHLPLALTVTAAHAATRPRLPLTGLATELADAAHRLDALHTFGDPMASVRTTLACSYRYLDADAARLFRLLGVHPGPDVSLPAAASLAGITLPQAALHLSELTNASLVSQDAARRYTMHHLIRLYAAEQAERADSEAERQAAVRRLLDHYLHTGLAASRLLRPTKESILADTPGPGTVPEALADYAEATAWFQAERHVLMAAIDYAVATGRDDYAWNIVWTMQIYFFYRGLPARAGGGEHHRPDGRTPTGQSGHDGEIALLPRL